MTYTIVGLFASQNQSKAVSQGLKSNGFKDSDYIVYVTDEKKVEKKSIWAKLFTEDAHEEAAATDSLIVSVAINNSQEAEKAKKVFAENNVVNTYELDNLPFEEAKNLDYVKKVVALKAKMLVYAMPEIKTSSSEISTGINTELNVGK